MLPRWHILFGAILTGIIYLLVPNLSWIYLVILFFSTFLIDFDHYVVAVSRTKKIGLFNSFEYFKQKEKEHRDNLKKGIVKKEKGDFMIFHTIEAHLVVLIIGLFFTPFLYVFFGMLFHSLLDLIELASNKTIYHREFFFINWLRRKLKAKR